MKKKSFALLLSLVLVLGVVAGSSLAWLTAKTDKVENTFTDSNIDITLTETDTDPNTDGIQHDYKMIPGWTIPKDPVVTVKAKSEDCWVFIKVEESASPKLDDYLAYAIDSANWVQLTDNDGKVVENVFVTSSPVNDINSDRTIKILGPGSFTDSMGTDDVSDDVTVTWSNMQVAVKPSVTKEMMEAIAGDNAKPKLNFTAYATQCWKNNTEEFKPYEAWLNINP